VAQAGLEHEVVAAREELVDGTRVGAGGARPPKPFYLRAARGAAMRGLCRACLSSNVEVVVDGASAICRACLEARSRER